MRESTMRDATSRMERHETPPSFLFAGLDWMATTLHRPVVVSSQPRNTPWNGYFEQSQDHHGLSRVQTTPLNFHYGVVMRAFHRFYAFHQFFFSASRYKQRCTGFCCIFLFCFMSFCPFIFLNTLEHCIASTVVPNSFVPYLLLCVANTDVQDYICLFYILLINTYHVYIRKNILLQIISGRLRWIQRILASYF